MSRRSGKTGGGEQHLENDAEHLVFLNESGVNTDMTRHYARSQKKERAVTVHRLMQQSCPPYG